MNSDLYEVRVQRVSQPHFGVRSFYVPYYRWTTLQPWGVFLDEYPTVWGFESEDDAWEACKHHAVRNP